MGDVYEALDRRLGRSVAIKVLSADLVGDPVFRERFEREARTVSRLQHPNICALFDIGKADGLDFLVLELLEGQSLASRLAEGPLPLAEVLEIGAGIASGLAVAHEQGIVHRDVKPGNVVLTKFGAKLLDFGLARELSPGQASNASHQETLEAALDEGALVGTLPYMAPEQLRGKTTDPRTDVWAMGCLLQECITARCAFRGESNADLIAAILGNRVAKVPAADSAQHGELLRVISRCLQSEPEHRFDSARELSDSLSAIRNTLGLGVSDSRTPQTVGQSSKQRSEASLVAREEELEIGRRILADALTGEGFLLALSGEPGIGKSRLMQALLRLGGDMGFFSLVGHCYESSGAPPYSPWVEVLEQASRELDLQSLRSALGDSASQLATLLPELGVRFPDLPPELALPDEQRGPYLLRCYRDFIERLSERGPILLVVEDLHWADEGSLKLLELLAVLAKETRLVVFVTFRDAAAEITPKLSATLDLLRRERLLKRCSLARLGKAEVAQMIESLRLDGPRAGSLARAIYSVTGGNPFFVEELVLGLDSVGLPEFRDEADAKDALSALALPENIRLAVGTRLGRLTEECKELLTLAAVLGMSFRIGILHDAQGGSVDAIVDALEEAERAQLLEVNPKVQRPTGNEYRFVHDLIRQTLLEELTLARRQSLHKRIADGIGDTQDNAKSQGLVTELAFHLQQSGPFVEQTRTREALALAGKQALRVGAAEEAVGFYSSAVDLVMEEDAQFLDRFYFFGAELAAALETGRLQDRIGSRHSSCSKNKVTCHGPCGH